MLPICEISQATMMPLAAKPYLPTIGPALILQLLTPELILAGTACLLFLIGCSSKVAARRFGPFLALLALLVVFVLELTQALVPTGASGYADAWGTLHVFPFSHYIKMLAAGVGFLLALLSWPSNRDATGNSAQNFGQEAGEFFALMLLSITGVFLVASANDMILLFLGIELASIPTYIMVSISRPLPVAQEAGVKYFFLGALAAALMLFGFSYLYGTTGQIDLNAISHLWHPTAMVSAAQPPVISSWQMLAVLMLIVGFAFKMAAVPLHFYAGDVYQGAATPVTAFLSFVPKTSGFVALVKILAMVGGASWIVPPTVSKLIWILAILTMSVGNVLGLLQYNIKRLLAYSSIAHSGYMLVGVAALVGGSETFFPHRMEGLEAVLFYLAAYGVMNVGAFAVLMLLPAGDSFEHGFRRRGPAPATSAETFEDIAGQGRAHIGLGLSMAVCCFSLIGIPLTVGFFGKLMLIRAALDNIASHNHMVALVVILIINAAVSAAYYLRIIGTMFLRAHPSPLHAGAVIEMHAVPPGEVELPDSEQVERVMEEGTEVAEAPPSARTLSFSAAAVADKSTSRLPSRAVLAALSISVTGTLFFGIILPGTDLLVQRADSSVLVDQLPGQIVVPVGTSHSPVAAARQSTNLR